MSGPLLAACLLLFATALAHSGLGEVFLLRPMGRVQGFPPLTPWLLVPSRARPGNATLAKQTIRFAWHLPSILGGAFALILGRYALLTAPEAGERFVLGTIAASLALCAALVFAATRGRHPGWTAFLVTAVLCGVAA